MMTDLPLVLRLEEPSDFAAIDRLHERAFGPGRFARTAYRLREGVPPIATLSFIAQVGTMLVGSVRLNTIKAGSSKALILGPLAVEPAFSDRGIGTRLMEMALDQAKADGHGLVFLVGDLPYYSRFGFKIVPQGRVTMPGPVDPQRFLALELQAGALEQVTGLLVASA
jgi:predicted N-acetyltransferase YhbS